MPNQGPTTIVQSRASVFEGMYVGVEATAGVPVISNLRLLSCEISPEPDIPSTMVEPQGFKAATDIIVHRETTKAPFKGDLAFNDILFFLASAIAAPTITTPVSATNARKWAFKSNMTGPDTINTLSIQRGSTAGGSAFQYGVVTDFDMEFAEKTSTFKGAMIGTEMYDGIQPPTSPTIVPLHTVSPKTLDVFVGTSTSNLAQIDSAYKFMWGLKGRHKPNEVLNSQRRSFKNTVEDKFGLSGQLVIEQDDTVGKGYMDDLRNAQHKFIRAVVTGSLIESGFNYGLQITFPFVFRNPKRGDNQGVYAGTYDIQPIYDATWGGAIEVVVVTDYAGFPVGTAATRPQLITGVANTVWNPGSPDTTTGPGIGG